MGNSLQKASIQNITNSQGDDPTTTRTGGGSTGRQQIIPNQHLFLAGGSVNQPLLNNSLYYKQHNHPVVQQKHSDKVT